MSDRSGDGTNSRMDAIEGIGIAAGLVVAAVITLWVPGYLEATPGWRSFWLVVGGLLGLTGAGGIGLELSRLTGDEGFSDIGAGLAVAGVGGVLHVLQTADVDSTLGSALRVLVVVLVLFAPTGVMRGVARIVLAERRADALSVTARVLSLTTALLGLAAALLNFLGAAH